eukprot:3914352-Ditylum_brightwellii.AAC.3
MFDPSYINNQVEHKSSHCPPPQCVLHTHQPGDRVCLHCHQCAANIIGGIGPAQEGPHVQQAAF